MQSMCRGCYKRIETKNERKIFEDFVPIECFNQTTPKKDELKIYLAIEQLIGQKVSKDSSLPQKICEPCFQKLELSINFRSQLLVTKNLLFNAMLKENVSLVSDQRVSKLSNSLEDTTLDLSRNKEGESLNVEKKISAEDLVNVDDNAVKIENSETNDLMDDKLQNDQENNNVDSDNSAENTFSSSLIKPDYDIESEIDVCSGEDDDVLELDVQKQNNETVEIDSSSESEIEVCDYEPMGKRGNYNTYTPPIRF